jgi:hypothetical protein
MISRGSRALQLAAWFTVTLAGAQAPPLAGRGPQVAGWRLEMIAFGPRTAVYSELLVWVGIRNENPGLRRLWYRVSGSSVQRKGGESGGQFTGGSSGGCALTPSDYRPIRARQTHYSALKVTNPEMLDELSQVTVYLDVCEWDERTQRGLGPTTLTLVETVQAIVENGASLQQGQTDSR